METQVSPLGVFISAFGVAAFAGLAALLRSRTNPDCKNVFSTLLNSGLLGLGISLIWYTKFQDNVYFLVGICLVSGLSGMSTFDYILQAMRQAGFQILSGVKMTPPPEEKKELEPEPESPRGKIDEC
jgi:hypothetical protein